VKVYALNVPRGKVRIGAVLRLLNIVRIESPDILQTWLYHADLLGVFANVSSHAKLVWNIRSAQHDGLHTILPQLCAALSGIPAAVVVNSVAGKIAHEKLGYSPKRWETIPNGFDTERFKPSHEARLGLRRELGLGDRAVLVGLIARFDSNKDHHTFFQAANELLQSRQDVHFVLAGDGITEQNQALVSATKIVAKGQTIHLLGPRDDIQMVTAALDVATCCSYGEAFPNVVGEAMACGVPVVVTKVGDAPRLVGTTGVVIEPRDASALASAWQHVVDLSSEERCALGRAGRGRIAALFSLESMVRQYETFYRSLSDEKSRGVPR
jgi:glycosyltransferase involved in cell wall biosynthesis